MRARLQLVLGALLLLTGCDGNGPHATSGTVPPTRPVEEGTVSTVGQPGVRPVTSTDVKREIKEAFDAASAYSADKRDQLAARLREQKAVLDRKVDELDTKSTEMTEQAKAEWARDKIVINQQRTALEARLEELKKTSEPAWADLKQGTKKAWDDFEEAVNNAAGHLNANSSQPAEKTRP